MITDASPVSPNAFKISDIKPNFHAALPFFILPIDSLTMSWSIKWFIIIILFIVDQ